MRWFKHLTQSSQDEKIMRLEERFGLEGYGAYFKILELIGAQLSPENEQTFVTFSLKTWRKVLGFPPKKLKNFADFSEKTGLFFSKLEGDDLTIDCPNILKYKDEWQRKAKQKETKTPEQLRSESGATPEPLLDTESEKDTESDKRIVPSGLVKTDILPLEEVDENSGSQIVQIDRVPYQKIVDLYHELLPELPSVLKLHDSRKTHVKARWNNEFGDLEEWKKYFLIVRQSSFLMGRSVAANGQSKPFQASFDWLINQSNAIKVCEGRYHG